MKRLINCFRKTNHFMYRQWDRVIEDTFLAEISKQIERKRTSFDGRLNVIINYRYVSALQGICPDLPILKKHECIVLVIYSDRFITAYKSEEKNHLDLLKRLRPGEILYL